MKRREFLATTAAALPHPGIQPRLRADCAVHQPGDDAQRRFRRRMHRLSRRGLPARRVVVPEVEGAESHVRRGRVSTASTRLDPRLGLRSGKPPLAWGPGPAERRAELEDAFTLAQALGIPRFVVYHSVDGTPAKDDYAIAAERLVVLADLAASYKVRIALEFIARSRLLGSLPSTLSVTRKAAHANVGVCLDTFHLFAGVSKLEDLDHLRPGEVEHVHFHDVPGAVPRELLADTDRTPPGTGVIPLPRVVGALRRIGYAGALSVELFDPAVPGRGSRDYRANVFRSRDAIRARIVALVDLMPITIESGPTSGSTRVEEKPASFIQPAQSAPV